MMAVLGGAGSFPGLARADIISSVLGCSGNPCVVKYNPGGEVSSFKAAAREIKRTGTRVIIDGPCYSACAILADQARKNVCVTSNARIGFHKGYVLAQPAAGGPAYLVKRFNPSHSRDISRWVTRNGGFPSKGFRVMGSGTAGKIWKRC
jgi:hypothetical protein